MSIRRSTKSKPGAAVPRKPGRPSAFRPEFIEQAYHYGLLGATDRQMAGFFEVSEVTFNAWKKEFPEFLKSLNRGKIEADAKVTECLFKRATGYSHPAVKIFAASDTREAQEIPYTEFYPPDTAAAIFWLKNRQRDLWRDKPEVQVTVNNEVGVDLSKPPEEWGEAELRAELARRGALPVAGGKR